MIIDLLRMTGKQVLPPLARRVGTAISVFLLAQGVPEDLAQQVILAAGVFAGLAFDVSLAIAARRKS